MSEVLNTAAVHNDGKPELIVGIRKKRFKIAYDLDSGVVSLTDPATGKLLTLDGRNINDAEFTERVYSATNEDEVYAMQKNPLHNGDIVYVEDTEKDNLYLVVDDEYLGANEIESKCTEGTISSNEDISWNSVCYGNGKFVAIGYFQYERLNEETGVYEYPFNSHYAYSIDGITWTEGVINDTIGGWRSICYGNGKFVVASLESNAFYYSTDAINWTKAAINSAKKDWHSICYGNGKFVAVGAFEDNMIEGYCAYSTDGFNWVECVMGDEGLRWSSICYGDGKFVAIPGGFGYYNNIFAYSADGITWTEGTISSTSRNWRSVCHGNGKFVMVGFSYTERYNEETDDYEEVCNSCYAYSTDGINWVEGTMGDTGIAWYSVCYGNDKYIAVGDFTAIIYNEEIGDYDWIYYSCYAYSTDGINWTEGVMSDTNTEWYSLCYGNDKYVAINYYNSACLTFDPLSAKAFKKIQIVQSYTKSEVDNLLSGIMKYCGRFSTYQKVLMAVYNGYLKVSEGSIVFVSSGGGYDANNNQIAANSHLLYDGTGWVIFD